MSILGWIILGLIAGWLAGVLVKGSGYGVVGDIVLRLFLTAICRASDGGTVHVRHGTFPNAVAAGMQHVEYADRH